MNQLIIGLSENTLNHKYSPEVYKKKNKLEDETLHQMVLKAVDEELDHGKDWVKPKKVITLADFIRENLCFKSEVLYDQVKMTAIYELLDALLSKANGDNKRVRKFLENIYEIGIRVHSDSQVRRLSSLFGDEKVSIIANDKAFLTKLKEKAGQPDITLANWGTLVTLYDNPLTLYKKYFRLTKFSLIESITKDLQDMPILKRVSKMIEGDKSSGTDWTFIDKGDLNYLNLVSIRMLLDFIQKNGKLIAGYLLGDYFDRRTEHGGLFMARGDKLNMDLDYENFTKFSVSNKAFDGRYSMSEAFIKKVTHAVSSFHFHAVAELKENEDLSAYSGPSEIGLFGDGDLSNAIRTSINDVVFTLAGFKRDQTNGKETVEYNAVWYGPAGDRELGGATNEVDLGLYDSDITLDEFQKIKRESSFEPIK